MSYPNLRSVRCKRPGLGRKSFDLMPFSPRGFVGYDIASAADLIVIIISVTSRT